MHCPVHFGVITIIEPWMAVAAVGLLIALIGILIRVSRVTIGVAAIGSLFGVEPDASTELIGRAIHRFGLLVIGFSLLIPVGFEPDLVTIVFVMGAFVVMAKTVYRLRRVETYA